jgi:hypothetical protein
MARVGVQSLNTEPRSIGSNSLKMVSPTKTTEVRNKAAIDEGDQSPRGPSPTPIHRSHRAIIKGNQSFGESNWTSSASFLENYICQSVTYKYFIM